MTRHTFRAGPKAGPYIYIDVAMTSMLWPAQAAAQPPREALQASDAPPIAAGQIELRAQVTLTAELR